jgi:hypothetical protein
MRKVRARPDLFAVCIDNVDYPASLESRKLYEIVPDDRAASHRQLRVIDESGEDYLYPAHYFRLVSVPPSLERALRRPRGHLAARRRATRPATIQSAE